MSIESKPSIDDFREASGTVEAFPQFVLRVQIYTDEGEWTPCRGICGKLFEAYFKYCPVVLAYGDELNQAAPGSYDSIPSVDAPNAHLAALTLVETLRLFLWKAVDPAGMVKAIGDGSLDDGVFDLSPLESRWEAVKASIKRLPSFRADKLASSIARERSAVLAAAQTEDRKPEEDSGAFTVAQLADRFQIQDEKRQAFQKALDRWRTANSDLRGAGWHELADPGSGKPRFLYVASEVSKLIRTYQ